jgi:hypothetical protein
MKLLQVIADELMEEIANQGEAMHSSGEQPGQTYPDSHPSPALGI